MEAGDNMTPDFETALISFFLEHGTALGVAGLIAILLFVLAQKGMFHLTLGKPPPPPPEAKPPEPPKIEVVVMPPQLPSGDREGDHHQTSSGRPRKRIKVGRKPGGKK